MAPKSVALTLLSLLTFSSASLYNETNLNHTCVIEPSLLSCSAGAQANLVDSCCTETYGGLLLSTQFWDTYTGLESSGQLIPSKSWTLHGLWPDFCNGSYTQYCDLSRQYDVDPSPDTTDSGAPIPAYSGPPVSTFIEAFGKYDLLAWMNTYWINQGASNADFWGHEFSKHATCYSTFDLPCYGPQYVEHEDVVQFYETAIMYYLRLPTYEWLSDAGITPSNSSQVTLGDFQGALTKAYGAVPYVGCSGARYNETDAGSGSMDDGRTVVDEVWYYQHVQGRPQEGKSVPVNATAPSSSCATTDGALWYYLRSPGSVRDV